MSEHFLEGRVALVTGASRGIGYHAALGYARAGAHVVALARTTGGLEELDDAVRAAGSQATLVPLDLADGPAIVRLAEALAERFGRLDVLLGNAAQLGQATPVGHMADADWLRVMEVNLHANWRLLRALDPLLRQSVAGRTLFVTCETARDAPAFIAAYAASKAGLEALVRSYAKEVARTAVRANLVLAPAAATRLRLQYVPGEDRDALSAPETVAESIVRATQRAGECNGATWNVATDAWLEPLTAS